MDATQEEWCPVLGWEATHEVSNHGRVRSVDRAYTTADGRRCFNRGKLLKARVCRGHLTVSLHARGRKMKSRHVHLIVLDAFIGQRPHPKLEGCHNDGDALNNHVSNLRWDTRKANALDCVRHGTHHHARKTHCKNGHEFTPENTYHRPNRGERWRACRECCRISLKNARNRRRQGKQQQEAA